MLPGSSLHAHTCKSMHAACCLLFLACPRMQIHTCSHKGIHCPRHNAVGETQNYYNIQILLQSENHFTVRKYYNACTQILQSSSNIITSPSRNQTITTHKLSNIHMYQYLLNSLLAMLSRKAFICSRSALLGAGSVSG